MGTSHWTPGEGTPTDYMIACFAGATEGQAAIDALVHGGFAPDDIVILSGIDAYETIRRNEESTLFKRIGFALENATGDGVTGRGEYLEELKAGHTVVFVYAPNETTQQQAQQHIEAARGYRISHYGQWVNTNL